MVVGLMMGLLAVPGSARAEEPEYKGPKIGNEVLLRSPQTDLKVGSRVAATGSAHRLYRVVHIRGDWLWIVAGDVSGWVRQDDVVTFDEAMEDYDQRISTTPHEAGWAYFQRGNLWLHKNEGARAVADFNEALAQSPNDSAIIHNRGLAWTELKDFNRAIADFTEALRLDPKYAWAYEDRGRAWAELGAHDYAVMDFTAALQLDPTAARALLGRGLAYVETGQPDAAITDLTEAVRLNPKLARAYTGRGLACKAKQEFQQALEDLEKALALAPQDADAQAALATIRATCPDERYRNGRLAYEAATRAYALHGKNCPRCLDTLAAAYAEYGDFPRAVAWETKAIAALAEGDSERSAFDARLALYKANKPFRDGPGAAAPAGTIAVAPAPAEADPAAR
jgi:tetratricopeptide (TPR) repeat protein